jgi:hypothetical protein
VPLVLGQDVADGTAFRLGITVLSGNQGTPGTVEANTMASSSQAAMTGATLSEMHARIAASNYEPEPVPTF